MFLKESRQEHGRRWLSRLGFPASVPDRRQPACHKGGDTKSIFQSNVQAGTYRSTAALDYPNGMFNLHLIHIQSRFTESIDNGAGLTGSCRHIGVLTSWNLLSGNSRRRECVVVNCARNLLSRAEIDIDYFVLTSPVHL